MQTRRCYAYAIIIAAMLAMFDAAGYAQPVDIPDANLRSAVRDTLGLPDGSPITRDAMLQLTKLGVTGHGIADLTGLEFATNLTRLKIGQNPIIDLSPIAELIRLESLYIWATPVSDITPVARLTNLNDFRASYCEITDISPLANLVKLEKLSLDGNHIVDVRPLAGLTLLKLLNIANNRITDHSPLDRLALTRFVYDQTCDMPPVPLQPRLENRSFPSVFAAWGGLGWSPVLNQPHLSDLEQMAQHDLYFCCLIFDQAFFDTGDDWEVRGELQHATQIRDDYIAENPDMIFLVELRMRENWDDAFPEDSQYWLRDAQGGRVSGWGTSYLMDFTTPVVQQMIIQQAIAVSRCGLYDGIFFDWWTDKDAILADYSTGEVYRGAQAEQDARDVILQGIRENVREDFLIMVNTNRFKTPRTAAHINGLFMESGTPSSAYNHGGDKEVEGGLSDIENTLRWAEDTLRSPQINGLEGWGFANASPDSPLNLRWMRAMTTLSLTFSDGYILYNNGEGHRHYWYDFWDADLGRPVGEKAQVYDGRDGLYIREYTNGWAVYNHSGSPQVITLPEEAQGVASGWLNTEHALPNLDGEMYLRVTPKNPADVNGDGVVNILDLTLVAQGFGTDEAGSDVNGDGVVNVFDLVFVANAF